MSANSKAGALSQTRATSQTAAISRAREERAEGETPEGEVYARRSAKGAEPLLRRPLSEDGAAVHALIGRCPPLDENSIYCNLLQASHFAATSVAAELDGNLVGFVSGYRVPERPDTLFIWQVAVAAEARGIGLAGRMVREILGRPCCAEVRFLETTITPDNRASWALFHGLARKLGAGCDESVLFDRDRHFRGRHDSETLLRIGPFTGAAEGAG
ncbi:diaminobutyrate acetyltransferase [Microbulbifer sp.]|uniref:diaminobutyrate acetyltransferase n=1 Tax=Microbulbifer sp. TaxID=1908541 RepID=UPI003F383E89